VKRENVKKAARFPDDFTHHVSRITHHAPSRQHISQELGSPPQTGAAVLSAEVEAKTESFFARRVEPQCGQRVPSHLVERTSSSLSRLQSAQ
jgi:hypothetical protein